MLGRDGFAVQKAIVGSTMKRTQTPSRSTIDWLFPTDPVPVATQHNATTEQRRLSQWMDDERENE